MDIYFKNKFKGYEIKVLIVTNEIGRNCSDIKKQLETNNFQVIFRQ